MRTLSNHFRSTSTEQACQFCNCLSVCGSDVLLVATVEHPTLAFASICTVLVIRIVLIPTFRMLSFSEIEKLKLSELTCREGIVEVAKMYVLNTLSPTIII